MLNIVFVMSVQFDSYMRYNANYIRSRIAQDIKTFNYGEFFVLSLIKKEKVHIII